MPKKKNAPAMAKDKHASEEKKLKLAMPLMLLLGRITKRRAFPSASWVTNE